MFLQTSKENLYKKPQNILIINKDNYNKLNQNSINLDNKISYKEELENKIEDLKIV